MWERRHFALILEATQKALCLRTAPAPGSKDFNDGYEREKPSSSSGIEVRRVRLRASFCLSVSFSGLSKYARSRSW
jgi:hypothetical protein